MGTKKKFPSRSVSIVIGNPRSTGPFIGIPFHLCHLFFKDSGQRHNTAGLHLIFGNASAREHALK